MGKRSDTRETVLLVLELLKRIPRKHKVTARELHDQLPVALTRDLRTVQRQLDMLSDAFDIEQDNSSRPYGYRWKEQSAGLTMPSMTAQESILLLLAEQHLQYLLPAKLMQTFSGFFKQARSQLREYGDARLEREWLKKVRVVSETQPLLPPRIEPEVFDVVSHALYTNHRLTLSYNNSAGRKTPFDVMPLGLAQQGSRLYLVCRFKGFGNERSLAMHRIKRAQAGLPFERPRDFDLKRYDDDGRFGFGFGQTIKLSFSVQKGAGRHLLESPLSTDQVVIEDENLHHITATVMESEQLKWWLRGFGDAVTVHAPANLLAV